MREAEIYVKRECEKKARSRNIWSENAKKRQEVKIYIEKSKIAKY